MSTFNFSTLAGGAAFAAACAFAPVAHAQARSNLGATIDCSDPRAWPCESIKSTPGDDGSLPAELSYTVKKEPSGGWRVTYHLRLTNPSEHPAMARVGIAVLTANGDGRSLHGDVRDVAPPTPLRPKETRHIKGSVAVPDQPRAALLLQGQAP